MNIKTHLTSAYQSVLRPNPWKQDMKQHLLLSSVLVIIFLAQLIVTKSLFRDEQNLDKKSLKRFLSTNQFELEENAGGLSIKIKTKNLRDFLNQADGEVDMDGMEEQRGPIRENNFSRIT